MRIGKAIILTASAVALGLGAIPASGATSLSLSFAEQPNVHTVEGVSHDGAVVFHLRTLKKTCRATSGDLKAGDRTTGLSKSRLERALRHGALRVLVHSRRATLSIKCAAAPVATVSSVTTERPHHGYPPSNSAVPTVGGSDMIGGSLTSSRGSWLNAPSRYSYQWRVCNTSGSACANISGATSASYTVQASEAGYTLQSVVTAANGFGSSSADSALTGSVPQSGSSPAPPSPPPVSPPADTAAPAISGTAAVGDALSASTGSWSGSPTGYAYQWQDCKSSSCSNIASATSSSYTVKATDESDTIQVVVTASNSGGSASADSAPTSNVPTPAPPPLSPPANTATPAITGTAAVGDALSASSGSWSGSPTGYTYQWQDCKSSCTNIASATSSSYTVAASDETDTIEVVVTASNSGGSASADSAPTGTVPTPAPPPTGATIAPTPDGPAAPSGGWSVEYGDAFNEPICGSQGTTATAGGCDNTLFPSSQAGNCADQHGFNSDEMEDFNCSQVSVGSNGLDLACTPATGLAQTSGYANASYRCGAVVGLPMMNQATPAGYKFFGYKPAQGQEWAIQIVTQFPQNTGEADPGWWAMDPPWSEEIDYFEGSGDSAGTDGTWTKPGAGASPGGIGMSDPTWIYGTSSGSAMSSYSDFEGGSNPLGFDPSTAFHTYTTVFYSNNSFSEYIDGKLVTWNCTFNSNDPNQYPAGGTLNGPVPSTSNATLGMLISYAMRDDADGDPDPYFSSGTRNWLVRSIGVYEDSSANGANTVNSGLAPGTTVSGS